MNQFTEKQDTKVLCELTIQLVSGEVDAFKKIYHIHFRRVFNFVSKFSLSNEDTEEIVQDTFLKLWDKRSLINPDKNLSSFLFTISQNLVIDKIRKYISEEKQVQKMWDSGVLNSSSKLTEEMVDFADLSDIVNKLVNELPTKRRTAYKLSREKGLCNREIADILKVSQGTIEKQLSKALRTLSSKLKSQYGILDKLCLFFPLFIDF